MCHDNFTRNRAWEDRVESEMDEEPDESLDADEEPIPPLQADDDVDEDLEVLTDGGDD